MQTKSWFLAVALSMSIVVQRLSAATPDQAYHRTPVCADGNCAPNRATNGYHATRWRPWPGGEPSLNTPIPPVGLELKKIDLPPRDKELELPLRPSATGDGATTEPSPNDKPSGGIELPPEFRDVTPKKPIEEPRPGNSSLQKGPMFPSNNPSPSNEPLLIGKKPMPLRSLSPEMLPKRIPADEPPPMLKIRPTETSRSGLTPEMVPWNDEDKNPVVRQTARITGSQVQQTIRLDEENLPETNNVLPLAIRVQHESRQPSQATAMASFEAQPRQQPSVESQPPATEWHSSNAKVPAFLPNVEAQPVPVPTKMGVVSSDPAIASPLRGVSQGNPLRR
jgi:hypothetical protein